jgi:L-ascorbate metabolism protein UlaG (beta-lactamase superfamily)
MKISWLGHACFLLESDSGTKIITDPYEQGSYSGAIGYGPINIEPHIVTVSHQHADHNYIEDFSGKAEIVDKPGKFKIKDVEIEGIQTYHDEQSGTQRGKNIIFLFTISNLRIAHFGDIGTLDIDYERLKNIDIVLIPVGGTFTIDAQQATAVLSELTPKIAIPMHFKTPKLGFDIEGVEEFLKDKQEWERRDVLEVTPQNINSFKKIVVLEYQR